MPDSSSHSMEELRAAVDEERRTRYFTIPMLREEFGQDWTVVSAELRRGSDDAVDSLFEQLEAARAEIGHLRDELVGADMWLERKTIHQEKQADKIAALEEQLEALTSERDLAMKAHHEALVAHGYEKQQKHGIEHEKARLQEQNEALRDALKAVMEVGDRSAVFVAEAALDSSASRGKS